MKFLVLSFCLLLGAVAIGCGDDDKDSSGAGGAGAGGTGGVPAQNCSNRCANRLSQCGSPASTNAAMCNPVCAQTPTEDELHCIETTDCTELLQAFGAHQEKCGLTLGSGGTGGSDAG
jgi:hypothetical protein